MISRSVPLARSPLSHRPYLEKVSPDSGTRVWRLDLSDNILSMQLEADQRTLLALDSLALTRYRTTVSVVGRILNLRDTGIQAEAGDTISLAAVSSGDILFLVWGESHSPAGGPHWAVYRCRPGVGGKPIAITISHMIGSDRYLSDLPYRRLVDKSLLADLGSFIARDASYNRSDYFGSILDASRVNGGLYVLPVSFAVSGKWMASSSALTQASVSIDDRSWTWEEFFSIGKRLRPDRDKDGVDDRFALPRISGLDFLTSYVLPDFEDRYITRERKGEAVIDQRLASLLDGIKAFTEWNGRGNPVDDRNWDQCLDAVRKGNIVFHGGSVHRCIDLAMYRELFSRNLSIHALPGQGQAGGLRYWLGSQSFVLGPLTAADLWAVFIFPAPDSGSLPEVRHHFLLDCFGGLLRGGSP